MEDFSTYFYTDEKIRSALRTIVFTDGTLRQKLLAAYTSDLQSLNEANFPEGVIRESFVSLINDIKQYGSDNADTVVGAIRSMDELEAEMSIERLDSLALNLADFIHEVLPFQTEIDADKRLATITATGRIYSNFFKKALLDVVSDERYDSSCRLLVDVTEIQAIPIVDDAKDMHEIFQVLKDVLREKIAFVVTSPVVLAIAKPVSTLAALEGIQFKIFRTREKAEKWLGIA
ncbi:MAG: hypothetical protein CMN78_02285 [Spirochaetales bacterium]|nr:hypothetical protein [Spirochaetales bacterium]